MNLLVENQGKCQLLGTIGLIVQGILGIIALLSLVWKRYYEFPYRRPWIIWFYDVSKQIFGSILIHVLNLIFSILKFKIGIGIGIGININQITENPCDYYFLNILLDTTIGIPILYFSILIITKIFKIFKINGIKSGEYGNPPSIKNFFKQLIIYIISLSIMKSTIYILLLNLPIFLKISQFILSRFNKFPNLQISFVLLIFPLIMNIFQYYIIDNLIQSEKFYESNKLIQMLHEEEEEEEEEEVQQQQQQQQHQQEECQPLLLNY